MKKIGILNQDISAVVAGMGHMDMITVADAGLPVPDGVRRIDLALREGLPGFMETVETLAGDLQVENVVVAQETAAVSPHIEEGLKQLFPDAEWASPAPRGVQSADGPIQGRGPHRRIHPVCECDSHIWRGILMEGWKIGRMDGWKVGWLEDRSRFPILPSLQSSNDC